MASQKKAANLKVSVENDTAGSDDESGSSADESGSSSGSESSSSGSSSGDSDSSSDESEDSGKPQTKRAKVDDMQVDDDDEVEVTVRIDVDPTAEKEEEEWEVQTKLYQNPETAFWEGEDFNSEEALKKKQERAKRFGIEAPTVDAAAPVDVNKLYESLGMDAENPYPDLRLSAILLQGVDDMSTSDIFGYFGEFPPGGVEWINDTSCNVVYIRPESAARAMATLSRPIAQDKTDDKTEDKKEDKAGSDVEMQDEEDSKKKKEDEEKAKKELDELDDIDLDFTSDKEDDDDKKKEEEKQKEDGGKDDDKEEGEIDDADEAMEADYSSLAETEVPEGRWRQGKSCPKALYLFMRFATQADKKERGAEKRSRYYQRHGNPNYGGQRGLISNSKRQKFYEENAAELVSAREELSRQKKKTLSQEAEEELGVMLGLPMDEDKDKGRGGGGRRREERAEYYSEDDSGRYDSGSDLESRQLAAEVKELTRHAERGRSMRMYADEEEKHRGRRRREDGADPANLHVVSDARDKLRRQRDGGAAVLKSSSRRPRDRRYEGEGDLRSRLGKRSRSSRDEY